MSVFVALIGSNASVVATDSRCIQSVGTVRDDSPKTFRLSKASIVGGHTGPARIFQSCSSRMARDPADDVSCYSTTALEKRSFCSKQRCLLSRTPKLDFSIDDPTLCWLGMTLSGRKGAWSSFALSSCVQTPPAIASLARYDLVSARVGSRQYRVPVRVRGNRVSQWRWRNYAAVRPQTRPWRYGRH
jgi:hypothetical protein